MPAVGDVLEREHREIDEDIAAFAAGLKAGEWRGEKLSRASTALRRHIYAEEVQLFPPLRDAGLFGPVAVMLREHGEIWKALDDLEASESDPDAAKASCGWLIRVLDAHNQKEEAILYPASARLLAAEVDAEIRSFLQDGVLPDGWVCEALRT